jgi:peptidoglycan hydrolase CwlO-like protein
MELDKQIQELKQQQQELVSKILGSNPNWCYLQGKIEALTDLQAKPELKVAEKGGK